MKKNNYEVVISAFATVLVIGAKNEEEEAMQFACDGCRMGDMIMDEATIKAKVPNKDLERYRAHEDVILKDASQ